MRQGCLLIAACFAMNLLCGAADDFSTPDKRDQPQIQAEPRKDSLALSPAVIMVKTQPNTSSAHVLTITNLTSVRFRFVLRACDVEIRDGKRAFVPAGEIEDGIARSAVFDPPALEVDPGKSAQVKVTLTVPMKPAVRAVAAIFQGQTLVAGKGSLLFTGSLGALITYNLSEQIAIHMGTPTVHPQTGTSNLTIVDELENQGQEPVIPKGTLAVLRSSGELIGRVAIEPHRLLPGEKFSCAAEYPSNLQPGRYRAMMSFEHEGGVETSSVEFQVE